MKKKNLIKIAYVTYFGALSAQYDGWSGTSYYISEVLKNQGFEISKISFADKKPPFVGRQKQAFYKRFYKKEFLPYFDFAFLKRKAKLIEKEIRDISPDLVFVPGYLPSHLPFAFIDYPKPLVLWSDATFHLLTKYLPPYTDLVREAQTTWLDAEKIVYQKSRALIFSTGWSVRSAIDDFGLSPEKVFEIPFGANIPNQYGPTEIQQFILNRQVDVCNLLFIGRNWIGKGGDVAVAVASQLNERGIKTKLTMVGSIPPKNTYLPDYIQIIPLINKDTPDGLLRLQSLLAQAHFLVHPTLIDCSPIVICEANSFGVPCLARKVGGVPWVIHSGKNGEVFEDERIVDEFCKYIETYWHNRKSYQELALSSYEEYCSRLNWHSSGEAVKNLLLARLQ